ncbi:uncharacterized protein [Elaeis guineensis]|uniref:uncharacterized protein n=1 Tax=Elaeis guineensis var. tenera TaxID=51953 RepID=UPI003C6CEBF7
MWTLTGRRGRPRPALGFRDASTAAMACRAVVLPRLGGPEVLEVRSAVGVPNLKPRDVLVRARAVSINPLDFRMRSGYGRSIFEPLLPLILGRDISGEVAAVGSSVSSLTVGCDGFGALHPTAVRGTYADYAILSEDELTIKPSSVTRVSTSNCTAEKNCDLKFGFKQIKLSSKSANLQVQKPCAASHSLSHLEMEASAIPFAALTAWRALKSTARITKQLLVLGGGGAVGLAAGCSVSTTCGSKSIDRVLEVGAEQAVDYILQDIESAIKEQFDVVLDTIGIPETERIGINLLKKGGHYMTLQGEAASLADRYGLAIGLPAAMAILLKKQVLYRCSHGIEYWWTYMRADAEGLDEIRRLSEAGKLKIPVEKTFPITQVREAHEVKDKRLVPGKVVLEVD